MKRLLLAGGGHSHLVVLKVLAEAPVKGEVTLLSPARYAVYSGMVPGVIAGHYGLEDCRIDLRALAVRAGVRIVEDRATRIDASRNELVTAGGRRLPYDLLSLDVGSVAGGPAAGAEHALRVRPVETFLSDWDRLRKAIGKGETRRIAVVGGGAAGVEVLLAMRYASNGARAEFSLFTDSRVLAGHNRAVQRRMARILASRGVAVRERERVLAVRQGGLELEGGRHAETQATVWVAAAGAPAWLAASGLATDAAGFVAVGETLQSISHPEIFAAGDCASLAGGRSAKSGVIAVRQGPVLARNLTRALAGAAPEPFREPGKTLALISCGGRYAVASWGRLAFEGAWVWRWKDRIDRRFVRGYRIAQTTA